MRVVNPRYQSDLKLDACFTEPNGANCARLKSVVINGTRKGYGKGTSWSKGGAGNKIKRGNSKA